MKQKTFIFGIGALGKLLFYHLQSEGHAPVAFVVDDAYCDCERYCDRPVVPYSRALDIFPAADYAAYVAIGYSGMNIVRQDVSRRLLRAGYSLPNYIHPSVIAAIDLSRDMGVGNLIFLQTNLDAYTQIGDGNIFYPDTMIGHDVKLGSYNFFSGRSSLAGDLIVGDRCFFGLNCTVKNGVRIADRCLIGAAAYVARDLESGSVLVPPRSVLLESDSEELIKKVMK